MTGGLKKRQGFRILTGMTMLCMLLLSVGMRASAAQPYTYTVTIHAGKQGHMANSADLTVLNEEGVKVTPELEIKDDRIVIRGLPENSQVLFDAQSGNSISLEDDGKYYIRGIRESGRDNGTASISGFRIEKDADFVVAYGMKGNLVAYTVSYQDTAGNTLAPDRTYYGNVGDMPIVAYLYLENYRPQAYNLTKTLQDNAAQNLFTFVYSPVERGSGGGGTGGGSSAPGQASQGTQETIIVTENVGTVPANGEAGEGIMTGQDAGAAAGPDEAGTQIVQGAEDAGAVQADGDAEEEEPEELINLDDEEVPLAGVGGDGAKAPSVGGDGVTAAFPMMTGILIGVAAVSVMVMALILAKKRKEEKEVPSNEKQ